jgi:uncharacterized protein GlcG (DUF336 family)
MLTLAKAQEIIAAALAGARSDDTRRIAVAVCDSGAHPVASAREDGAAPLLAHIAQVSMGQGLTGSLGGVIPRDAQGRALGAVGVAGEAGEFDEALACRGIEAAGFVADPG